MRRKKLTPDEIFEKAIQWAVGSLLIGLGITLLSLFVHHMALVFVGLILFGLWTGVAFPISEYHD